MIFIAIEMALYSKLLQISKQISRTGLFFIGTITILFYFWSLIGILIGVLMYFLSKQTSWKINGLVLGIGAGLGTLFLELIANSWQFVAIGLLLIYAMVKFTIYVIGVIRNNHIGHLSKKNQLLLYLSESSKPKIAKDVYILLGLIPILLWAPVSVNFGVMFDNQAKILWINAPSTTNTGETITVAIQAWDRYERLSASYRNSIKFNIISYNKSSLAQISEPNVNLPAEYKFTGSSFSWGFQPAYLRNNKKDFGQHLFNLQIYTEGIHYLKITDLKWNRTYWSNPIFVSDFTHENSLLKHIRWGDIHSHSMLSDGSGSASHAFHYAQNIARLDFYALTDHGENMDYFGLKSTRTNLFTKLENAANQAYQPGKFVTFPGIEWTTNYLSTEGMTYGHYTVICSGNSIPFLAANVHDSPDKLWDTLDEFTNTTSSQALALPHHTVRNAFIQDWAYLNPKYVRLAEVCSVHGSSLYIPQDNRNVLGSIDHPPHPIPGSAITDALNMGFNLTLYASGDSHDGHPGHSLTHTGAEIGHQYPFTIHHSRAEHPYPTPLTAVYTSEMTRETLFNALYAQRVYANSDHGRPILHFKVNNHAFEDTNEIHLTNTTDPRVLEIFLAQDGSLAAGRDHSAANGNQEVNWKSRCEIIKNGDIFASYEITEPIVNFTIIDTDPVLGTEYTDFILRNGSYYIHEKSTHPIDPNSLNTNGDDYYIVRFVGENGRVTYLGPMWIRG